MRRISLRLHLRGQRALRFWEDLSIQQTAEAMGVSPGTIAGQHHKALATLRRSCTAGHSLGELVALHAAGVMDAVSLLRLAGHRGDLLARVSEPSTMLAVSADADTVSAEISASGRADLWLANLNASRQTVVSGTGPAIEALGERLSAAGVTVRRLAVSAAFHSPLRLLTASEPWAGPRRRAAISAFGFGGNNAHLIVEACDGQPGTFSVAVPGSPAGPRPAEPPASRSSASAPGSAG